MPCVVHLYRLLYYIIEDETFDFRDVIVLCSAEKCHSRDRCVTNITVVTIHQGPEMLSIIATSFRREEMGLTHVLSENVCVSILDP